MSEENARTILGLAVAPFAVMLDGFVLLKLWGWFIVPAFGLAPPSLGIACGLVVFAGFLSHQYIPKPDSDGLEVLGVGIGLTLTAWFVGWLIHLAA